MKIGKELLLTVGCLLLFCLYPLVIQYIDPAARSIDFSYVHMLIMRILGLTTSVLVLWILLHVAFPTLESYTNRNDDRVPCNFVEDFKNLPSWGRFTAFLLFICFMILVLNT